MTMARAAFIEKARVLAQAGDVTGLLGLLKGSDAKKQDTDTIAAARVFCENAVLNAQLTPEQRKRSAFGL
jgi:hypothetical protein